MKSCWVCKYFVPVYEPEIEWHYFSCCHGHISLGIEDEMKTQAMQIAVKCPDYEEVNQPQNGETAH